MTEEKKTRVPSHASKMKTLLGDYYKAVRKREKTAALLNSADSADEEAIGEVDAARAACEAAGFTINN